MADFFQAPDPAAAAAGPSNFELQRKIAAMLMKQGGAAPQGTMAGGQYVPPSPAQYVAQLGSAAAGGYQREKMAESARATDILNGGTGGEASPYRKASGWLSNFFGGS